MRTSTKNIIATSHRIRLPLRTGQDHARSGEFHPRVAERPSWGRRPGDSHRKGDDRVADRCGVLAAVAEDQKTVHRDESTDAGSEGEDQERVRGVSER